MTNQTEILPASPQECSPNTILPVYQPDQQDTFNSNFIRLTQQRWELNSLYQTLSTLVGHGGALKQMLLYNIGTSKRNGGSTIFWQQEENNPNAYTGGVVVRFEPNSGEAVDNYFTTVQDILADQYGLERLKAPIPDLIGSHLVRAYPTKPIIISHNPITALVGSHHLDQYTWLATPEHPLVDLTGPSCVRALPSSAPILLIAEPNHEEEWSRAHYVISTFLSVYPHRRIELLISSSLPGFTGSMATWIANDPHYANWIIERTISVSAVQSVKPKLLQHG